MYKKRALIARIVVWLAIPIIISMATFGFPRTNYAGNDGQPVGPGGDPAAHEALGVRLAVPGPDVKPAIPMEKAIETARAVAGPEVAQASSFQANFVLFSDDQYCDTSVPAGPKCHFQNVPAWVVTFSGIKFAMPGGPPDEASGPNYATEIHVVINAMTGEFMELYTYK